MHPGSWQLTEDIDDFLARAGQFLRLRPASHSMQLTWVARLRTRGPLAYGVRAPVLGLLEQAGEVRATFYHLPPSRGLGLTPLTPGQTDALAARLAARGDSPVSVSADRGTAAAFADAWQRHTGAVPAPRTRLCLHRLGTLTPPKPFPGGRARAVGDEDAEQLMCWCHGFAADVGEAVSVDAGSWASTRFADKRYTFWETPRGTPVSMAGLNPMVAGMAQVDPVYTPAPLRGHGYAGAVTAEVSRAALAAGAEAVVLFTDAANPTSNALYQRLGYLPVSEWAAYDFAYGRAVRRTTSRTA